MSKQDLSELEPKILKRVKKSACLMNKNIP